jgi:hypothetical protein
LSRSPLEIFCDRSLGRIKVPGALRQIHPVVFAHDDVFPQDTADDVWLEAAGRNDWVVLMRDDRIRYRPAEQAAVLSSGVRCFCLNPSKNMTGDDMAAIFVAALPRILAIASGEARGYIKGLGRSGRIRHMWP